MLTMDGLGHEFRIGGKEAFVGSAVPLKGTTVTVVGQIGCLVLPRWFVQQEGIEGGIVQQ
jgi:hypothetical protein